MRACCSCDLRLTIQLCLIMCFEVRRPSFSNVVGLWFQSRVLWKQGGFMASSRGQRPRAQGPPSPGALTAPWWQVKPPLVPGGLRGTALGPRAQGTTRCPPRVASGPLCVAAILLTVSLPKRFRDGRFASGTTMWWFQKRNHHLDPEVV
jgi:hypothetical protein